jgi:hypothetical protein
MITTPFLYEEKLTDEELKKIGQLALRWSHTEHILGNCLKVMLGLTDEQAIVTVFPLSLHQRLDQLRKLAAINPPNDDAKAALAELLAVMPMIQAVRNGVIHAIIVDDGAGEQMFHLRSKERSIAKKEAFEAEELTNFAAHAALSLRHALGFKDVAGSRHALPGRPEIPASLQRFLPTRRK